MDVTSLNFVEPIEGALATLLNYLPQLVGAFVILLVGYFVAKFLQAVAARMLRAIGFNNWMERANVGQFLERVGTKHTPASLLGKLVFYLVFVMAFAMFAEALGVSQITVFFNSLLTYIPRIFAALAILFLAALFANFVAGIVRGATNSEGLAKTAHYTIVIYAVFVALSQLRIAQYLTGTTFLILLAGAALAAGIAFGLGGREIARDLLQRAYWRQGPDIPRPETPQESSLSRS